MDWHFNKWLLVQFGKDQFFWSHLFSSRITAQKEGRRDEKNGSPYIVVDADALIASAKVSDVELAKIGFETFMKSLSQWMDLPSEFIPRWEDQPTSDMNAWTEVATAIRAKLLGSEWIKPGG